MSEITTVGLDLAKNVFQVHGADGAGRAVLRKKLRRAQVLEFFRQLPSCVVAMEACGVIPPRKNAQLWKPTTAGAIARNEAVRACKYLGRALWRKLIGYHRRSRAETKMHCVKLLGQGLMARDFDRQVAELQIRIAVLNRYTALGIPVTKPVG
ncbi:hypothetical protein SAMN06265173_1269 [Thalassovita litoralis]|uniref:Transposase n=1 Tax=Thalassovita litoralis TaxID=1010611 RepID=A0A521FAP2_9RHOB|nr:hypothetical protein SAMN06265173_1269 [Thalassovita litoralis]